ncbi:competence ComEA-like helix-hairpin-helix protein [Alkalibacillus flavidus]|uniref:Competence ComEA-like helix-hairpin-helix protein n=1 Tax=Alkalibacillus flavidus TaxID=546021 RepID=A0ABV2KTQ1_9BACI
MIKKFVSLVSIVSVSVMLALPTAAADFSDVSDSHQFSEEIDYLANESIINGLTDGSFNPSGTVTRGQAATMLGRALDLNGDKQTTEFPDVDPDSYASGYIQKLTDMDVIDGYPDGTFGPNDDVNRGQMAKLISEAFELNDREDVPFTDIPENDWKTEHVEKLVANDITNGYPDDTYRPSHDITRGAFSAMIYRTMTQGENDTPVAQGDLEVHFINVGQGDSTLLTTPNDKTILIDAGKSAYSDEVVSYLNEQNIDTIDHVIATHAHADHIGGMTDVFDSFNVENVYGSGVEHSTQTYDDYQNAIDTKGIDFDTPEAGETLVNNDKTNLEAEFVYAGNQGDDINNASVALHVSYDEASFLFTGDAEAEAEQDMLNHSDIANTDVYKVGHHGSNSSSSESFIDTIEPEYAIFSYGADNSYGHPHDEVVNRLEASNTTLYSTAAQDDIVIETNGQTYDVNVEPWDGEAATPENDSSNGQDDSSSNNGDDAVSYPVNLNTADHERLQDITNVGPTIANRVINYRDQNGGFDDITEMKLIKGIGDVTLNEMKDEIVAE